MTAKSTRRAAKRASASNRRKMLRKRPSVKANALYHELFASSPDGMLLIDAETQRIVEFNDAACRQLGYTREEFGDLRISDYEASETPEETDGHVHKALREGKAEFDTLHRTKTGKIRHVHVWTKTVDLDGRVVFYAIFRDITERVHAEDERREIGTRLAVVLDNITDGFFTLDGELRYTDINISGATMVGRTPEQLIGRLLLDEFPQAADTSFLRAYRRVLETREACVAEDYYAPLDRWFEARVYPSPAGVSVFFSDVTERKRVEEALRASQAQLQIISDNVLDLVAQISLDGTYVYVSPSYETVLGYPSQRLMGTSAFAFVHPEDLERVQAAFAEAIQQGTGRAEFRYRHADGRYIWVDTLGKVFIDEAGAWAGAVLSTRDITKRKQDAEALRHSRDLLDQTGQLAKVGGWELDLDTQTLFWTEEVYRLHEVDPAIKPTVAEAIQFYAPEARPVITAAVQAAIDAGTPFDLELPLVTARGRRVWVHALGNAESRGGKTARLYGAFQDITERKHAEEVEARLVAILEATSDLVSITDREGRLVYLNRAGRKMLGIDALADLTRHNLREFHGAASVHVVLTEGIPTAIRDGAWSGDTEFVALDGHAIAISQVILAHKAPDGTVAFLSTIARDITLQKEHEKHITRLNRVYAVLSGINTTIVRTRDRQELFDAACRIAVELGKFRLAWIGLLDANGLDVTPVARAGVDEGYLDNIQLTARDDAPRRCEMVARALREKTAVVCNDIDTDPQMARWREEALRRSYRSVVVFPLQFDDKVLGVLLLYASEKDFFDTEEMKLLTELAGDVSFALDHIEADESRQVQSAALNAAADAIVITDRAGVIEWVNPAFTQITGYTAEEALGKNPWDLVKSGKHAPAFYQDLWETILGGRTWHGEMINRRKDGRLYTEDQSVTPILDASGAITHFVAVKQDMTERLQLEAEFRQAQKMESVGQLASGIAHDFNNLVTVINGMSDLVLAQVSQDDPVHADLQEIHRAGERAATLTRQLLAFSRQQILEPRVLKVDTVIAGMEDLLRRVLGEDIDLVVVPAPDVGHVKADPGQIEQVITNLAVNARDAMPQGGRLTIETESVTIDEAYTRQHGEDAPPGSYVRLTVSDSGAGMDEATRARIFEPFFTTKGPGKGTGLGLSTVYGIVTQSQGFIWVYSEVGRGTSFKIYLPQVTEAAGTDQPRPRAVSSTGTETILLAEDNAGLRKLATRVLAPAGYTVLAAATGEEALRVLERHEPPVHLLLSDVVMPGMSGRDLAERIAQTRPGMKVLYMSGYTSDTIVRHGVLEARVPFLNKPFTAAALLRKVREVLDS